MLKARHTQFVPEQVQDSDRAPVSVSVLTPSLNRVRSSKHLHNRCFWGPAPALVVPCTPMPVVTSVSQMAAYQVFSHPASECIVDHALHGLCPNVMTFGEPTRSSGFLHQGGMASKVLKDKVCPPSLATRVPTVGTPNWSRPMGFYPSWWCYPTPKCATYICMCLTSLPWVAAIIGPH